ncbi:MAG: hypothetical protein JWO05_44 [Gemmatimonadetes bacterium]|nr:hypothetical protein [Gemmatimonadota bacterium]
MRLSEKSIELNFCAQLQSRLGKRILWFGLTQAQEKKAGFDAYTRVGGRLLILQFKASAYVLKNGARRFHAPHHQLDALRKSGRRRQNSVFYVFPGIGTSVELARDPDLVKQCQFLDAGSIPDSVKQPTRPDGKPRKNKVHHVDVSAGIAVIHSEPVTARLVGARQLLESPSRGSRDDMTLEIGPITAALEGEYEWFEDATRTIRGAALAAIILD